MKYTFSATVRDDDKQREAFNALTSQTFGFDFRDWYEAGHWGDFYIPHTLFDGDKAISNVSVNLMQFDILGEKKNYIQLGTVMTDEAYRGQGLNRWIMEQILEKYEGKADGIYLFGNDSVLEYYPKFGFVPAGEYEYFMPKEQLSQEMDRVQKEVQSYRLEKVDALQLEFLYNTICHCAAQNVQNPNDGMYMNENLSLYQFWMAAGYGDSVYWLPETGNYVVAEKDDRTLRIQQIFGENAVDIRRFSESFEEPFDEIVLGFTPAKKEQFLTREYKEEDCTLFILGKDLERIERERMIFPVLSHA